MFLTRFEVARILGMRALQLDAGAVPHVQIEREDLRCDSLYVAAMELWEKKLDAVVHRGDQVIHVRKSRLPSELALVLDNRDGGVRGC